MSAPGHPPGLLTAGPRQKATPMATRTLSRRALRDEHDQAEQKKREAEASGDVPEAAAKVKKPRTRKAAAAKPAGEKAPAKPRVRKKTVKVPPVLFARWA